MKWPLLLALLPLAALDCRADGTNLVANGSFEQSAARPGAPDGWMSAGNPAVHQTLTLDAGRDGGRCAKLDCTLFAGDGPDFHVMLCQTDRVAVRRGQWYRLTFWARGRDIQSGAVEIGLVNTRDWESSGLSEAFTPRAEWGRFEFRFQAQHDVPTATSRLQFWFKGTGTLWLDDVSLAETSEGREWFPQIPTDGVKNFVPNSSFECGAANWGSFTYGLSGWAGNLYRLEGTLDGMVSQHGPHSLRIAIGPGATPVFWFDYYDPIRQPVRRVLAANQGWFRVKPGEPLTLSAFLRADAEGVVAQLAANEAPDHLQRRAVTVGRQWQRHAFTFTPTQPFLFIAVGLDLDESKRDAATLWLDAVQLERGDHATAYEPRQAVESFLETSVPGNIFTNVARGASFTVRAFNNGDTAQSIRGKLTVTDFFDRTVSESTPTLRVPAHSGANAALPTFGRRQRGFFRATWTSGVTSNSLRCAVLPPAAPGTTDSPFGFNHAYPWDFLVRFARQAGIVWWRDWSAKWQTVEPAKERFDFTTPDQQIQRVLALGGQVEVLLPFPSAAWSTSAKPDEVRKAAGGNDYLQARLPLAYAPNNSNSFGYYAGKVVRHYSQSQPRRVTTYQVLNEPVYTDYALPRKFGYTLGDYLSLLQTASGWMKDADPQCRIVGGISANLDAGLTRDFVAQGGLRFVDVFDLHIYDPPRPAGSYEDSFRKLEELMRAHGGPKPVWITEWGCYADDDPPCLPESVGDASMNRCRWPSERAATEHIVKFTAVAFAHGVRKIFFHAGTCGTINGPDAGGVLFEYGGTPRKMYAGVAALSGLLGVPDAFVKEAHRDGLRAYVFRCRGRLVAVAWGDLERARTLTLEPKVAAYDVMGNRLPARNAPLGESPVYLVSPNEEALLNSVAGTSSQ